MSQVGDKKYVLAPVQTRGIPHGYVPGVHRVLEDYVEAVDRVATEQSSRSGDTVNGLFSLPFSAFTQVGLLFTTSTSDLAPLLSFVTCLHIHRPFARTWSPPPTARCATASDSPKRSAAPSAARTCQTRRPSTRYPPVTALEPSHSA